MEKGSSTIDRLCRIQQDAYADKIGVKPPEDEQLKREDVNVGDTSVHYHQNRDKSSWLWPLVGAAILGAGVYGGSKLMDRGPQGPDRDTRYRIDGPFEPVGGSIAEPAP